MLCLDAHQWPWLFRPVQNTKQHLQNQNTSAHSHSTPYPPTYHSAIQHEPA